VENAIDRRLERIVLLEFVLHVVTGLRVGAQDGSFTIGGDENVIIRDPLSNRPYVPGSSLKGKMRSLIERTQGMEQNWPIARDRVVIHACRAGADYDRCPVCSLFGAPAPQQRTYLCQTRLRVSDLFLTDTSEQALREAGTTLPYVEVKAEAAIDRVTSAAVPRTMERVPAGAEFGGRLTLLLYEGDDPARSVDLTVQALELVEADFLGGGGSRGSGRVTFQDLTLTRLTFAPGEPRAERVTYKQTIGSLDDWRAHRDAIVGWAAGS